MHSHDIHCDQILLFSVCRFQVTLKPNPTQVTLKPNPTQNRQETWLSLKDRAHHYITVLASGLYDSRNKITYDVPPLFEIQTTKPSIPFIVLTSLKHEISCIFYQRPASMLHLFELVKPVGLDNLRCCCCCCTDYKSSNVKFLKFAKILK